ncbi:MAG: hypothetical protein ACT4N2_13965 [Hyphomicrobium sp.]
MRPQLSFLRRTPLRVRLEQSSITWTALADAAIADAPSPAAGALPLAIADLSPLPRIGFKGRGTIDAMKKRGVLLDATPNRAFRQPDGGLCLVLGTGEVMLLANLKGEGNRLEDLAATWRIDDGERTYPLLRRDSHAWLAVMGEAAPALLAKLCAVDFRPAKFADLSIAQTPLAKISAIIVRCDAGPALRFHMLADSTSALYLCDALLDAAREFGGHIVGVSSVREREGS